MRERTLSPHRLRVCFSLALLFCAQPALCTARPDESHVEPAVTTSYGVEGGYKELVQQVEAARAGEYSSIVRHFASHLSDHPGDSTLRLEACRFSHYFADAEDGTVEASTGDAEKCDASLRSPAYEMDGPIQIFLLDQLYGAARLARAEKLLPEAYAWPLPLRARLYEAIAEGYRKSNPEHAAQNLMSALQLDPLSSRRVQLAQWLAGSGARDRALKLLQNTPPAAWANLPLEEAGRLLIELNSPADAVTVLRRAPERGSTTEFLLARALELDGQFEEARAAFLAGLDTSLPADRQQGLTDSFDFELRHGTRAQAVSAFARVRDLGARGDPWGRRRLALFMHHPSAPWAVQDFLGVLRCGALLAVLGLLPGLIVLPVHYRSLAKRLRGWTPSPGAWGLGAIWGILDVIVLSPLVLLYLLSYDTFASVVPGFGFHDRHTHTDFAALGNVLVGQTLIFFMCAAWLLRSVNVRSTVMGRVPLRATLGRTSLALLVVMMMLGAYASMLHAFPQAGPIREVATQALKALRNTQGPWSVVLIAAVLIPVVEEIFFRGVMLSTLSRYMTFGWAALLQAALFAGLHESVLAFPFLFGIGLLTAWLVRKNGGLLGPMLLHGFNNLIAVVSLLGATDLIPVAK